MKYFLFVIFILGLTVSCDENTVKVTPTGDLMGKVEYIFQTGETLPDNSGIYVSLNGKETQAVTDENGFWTIKEIDAGVYDVSFFKKDSEGNKDTDYDITEIYSFQFVGNGTAWVGDYKIFQRSNNEYNNDFNITIDGDNVEFSVSYATTFTSELLHQRLFLYSGDDVNKYYDDVKNANRFDFTMPTAQPFSEKAVNISVSLESLSEFYSSGQTVYARIYPGYSEVIMDPRTEIVKFLGLGEKPTGVKSFVMP